MALEFLGLGDDHNVVNLSSRKLKTTQENCEIMIKLFIRSDSYISYSSACCCMLFLIQELQVNMIITDYSMSGMSGYDLLKRVKVFLFCLFYQQSKVDREVFMP